MKLETSRNVTKSKRSLHWCRSISKNICTGFITVSVKKLLHYRAGGLLQYRAVLLHYRAVITLSGVFFITLSGTYYSIGRLLHYRLVQPVFLPLGCYSDHHEEPPSIGATLVNNRGYTHATFTATRQSGWSLVNTSHINYFKIAFRNL